MYILKIVQYLAQIHALIHTPINTKTHILNLLHILYIPLDMRLTCKYLLNTPIHSNFSYWNMDIHPDTVLPDTNQTHTHTQYKHGSTNNTVWWSSIQPLICFHLHFNFSFLPILIHLHQPGLQHASTYFSITGNLSTRILQAPNEVVL